MLKGKGIYIWKIQHCENGDVNGIVEKSVEANFSHLLIKIANGIYSYNYDWKNNIDLVPPLAGKLHQKGIQVWGWHYIYGEQPIKEAHKAIQRIRELNVDGFIINAEGHYRGKYAAAKSFMDILTSEITDIPIGFSSYRYPSYHPQVPWNEFLSKCDINMPQVYWLKSNSPGSQLEHSVKEYQNLEFTPPIFPTGSAYQEWGWSPTTEEIQQFLDKAKTLNLKGANFWEWSSCRENLPHNVWETIRDYTWEPISKPPDDITESYVEALNTHDPTQIVALYQDNAVHITSERTVQGLSALKEWYSSLFQDILPDATFSVSTYSGTGPTRHLTWTASSSNGRVQNGRDTFGLHKDKIAYHYCDFSVTP